MKQFIKTKDGSIYKRVEDAETKLTREEHIAFQDKIRKIDKELKDIQKEDNIKYCIRYIEDQYWLIQEHFPVEFRKEYKNELDKFKKEFEKKEKIIQSINNRATNIVKQYYQNSSRVNETKNDYETEIKKNSAIVKELKQLQAKVGNIKRELYDLNTKMWRLGK